MRYLLLLLTVTSCLFCTGTKERNQLLTMVSGEWKAQALYTATSLDIATYLADGPKSITTLAKHTGCKEDSLYRVLRLLASCGIFEERNSRLFSHTETSKLLISKAPGGMRNLILFYGGELSQSMKNLYYSVKEGKPAFELTYGKPVFSFFKIHPEAGDRFNLAMKEKSQMVINSCLDAYDFGKFSTVYDIGGGLGHFMSGLLKRYTHIRGLLFDTPEVIAKAEPILIAMGPRCGLMKGDFFESIPSGGQAYLLKSVLHDWEDDECLKILNHCRLAMKKGGKLLIIEPLMAPANEPDYAKSMDLLMMAITGGKERSEKAFRSLLYRAGFVIDSITRTETEFAIIEASKI